MLPISSLNEPPECIHLRQVHNVFTAALKKEMLDNPTGEFVLLGVNN